MTQNRLQPFVSAGMLLTLVLACFTPAGAQSFAGVITQHNDVARTGQNLNETILTPSNVSSTTFGKIFSYSVDGQIYAQPLYVPNVSIAGGTHNVVYVVTQNDSLYAFDADGLQSAPLFQVSFINPAGGILPVSCEVNGVMIIGCAVYPIYGITATPVIDLSTNTIYLVTRTWYTSSNAYYQTLHALDMTTGAEKFGGPVNIEGSVPGTGSGSKKGVITFDPLRDIQRVGLLEANGNIYIAWAGSVHGWIMAYNATTLAQTAIFATTPNASMGGVWQTGNGLAADASGNIYGATGNATFDVNTGGVDYGDTLLEFDADLSVEDYFTPDDQACRAVNDLDLASAGPLLLPTQPGSVPNELIIAGKGGAPCDSDPVASRIYLLNQDDLGGYNATQDQDVEEIIGSTIGYYSSFAYWQGASATDVYSAGQNGPNGDGDYMKMYSVTNGLLSTTPVAESSNTFNDGATPSISANGTSNGIVWATERQDALDIMPGMKPAILYAYDATDMALLYDSTQAQGFKYPLDQGGCGNKFAVPTIANGKVYVGTQNELDIFGLISSRKGANLLFLNPCWTFPASAIGTPVKQALTLGNNGKASMTISSITITGTNAADFTQTNTCPTTLKEATKCVVTVSFTASVLGPETAYVTITDSTPGSPHNMYLLGVGKSAASAVVSRK
jgi:hypothetical protein